MEYTFPIDIVSKDENICIYGCGKVGKMFLEFVRKNDYCNVSFIIDEDTNLQEYCGIPVKQINLLTLYDFFNISKVIIATHNPAIAREMYNSVVAKGVSEKKIVFEKYVEYDEKIYNEKFKSERYMYDAVDLQLVGVPQFIEVKNRYDDFSRLKSMFLRSESTRWGNLKDITRLIFLWTNLESVLAENSGAVAELGVFQGSTASVLADVSEKYDRKLYLFDTFEGFDEKDLMGFDEKQKIEFDNTSLELVRKNVGNGEFIQYVRGYFPNSITCDIEKERFAFVHIDCDLYKPIKAGLEFFSERLDNKGLIIVHDYYSGYWEGAKQAVDEFLHKYNFRKVILPDLCGSVALVKGY